MKYYKLIGYGSLVSHKSLKETCEDKKFSPIIVKGYKRIFNIKTKLKKDILNLKKSKNNYFNAILFKVTEKELEKIKSREDIYNFEKIKYSGYTSKKRLGEAFASIDHIIAIDNHKNKPNKEYFILCREAAYQISKEFGELWDNTTFTSDNKKVSNWIKDNKSYDTIK